MLSAKCCALSQYECKTNFDSIYDNLNSKELYFEMLSAKCCPLCQYECKTMKITAISYAVFTANGNHISRETQD